MTLRVLRRHIMGATTGDPGRCPIARAAEEQFLWLPKFGSAGPGRPWLLHTWNATFRVVGGALWARQFDAGKPVKPTTFRLERIS